MRRFRRLFVLLFILSLFAGAIHQANHIHHGGELCEVCVLSHSPALLNDSITLASIESIHTPFISPMVTAPKRYAHPTRSRSPPIA